jgi:hypothetical protein
LTDTDHKLAINFYAEDKGEKSSGKSKQIALRKRLAKEAGLTSGALRTRMNRLRSRLEGCVAERMNLLGRVGGDDGVGAGVR